MSVCAGCGAPWDAAAHVPGESKCCPDCTHTERSQWRRPLTDDEMEMVLAVAAEAGDDAAEAFAHTAVAVFSIAMPERDGRTWVEFVASDDVLHPWDYAIPTDQWQRIGLALVERETRGPVPGVNALLDWMNKGPSAY